jgi:hypothetical protein
MDALDQKNQTVTPAANWKLLGRVLCLGVNAYDPFYIMSLCKSHALRTPII